MNICIILTIVLFSFAVETLAQAEFKYEVIDSVQKSSSQIYADTKRFIATKCHSFLTEIEYDDKESGVIIMNGVTSQTVNIISDYACNYKFTVAFFVKGNTYRIIIDNVLYDPETSSKNITPLNAYMGETEKTSYELGIFKSKADALMVDLNNEFHEIINSYILHMKAPKKNYFFGRLIKN